MDPAIERRPPWVRPLMIGAVVAATLYVVYLVRAIWPPVLVAFVFAITLDPVVDRLENRGWSRMAATGLIFVLFLGLLVSLLTLLLPPLTSQTGEIARALSGLFPDSSRPGLEGPVERLMAEVHAPPGLRAPILRAARESTDRFSQSMEAASLYFLSVVPNLIWLVIVPILTFYALSDFHRLYAKALLLVPPEHHVLTREIVSDVSTVLGRYMRGLALVCVLNAISTAMILVAFGIPYALILALLSGMLYAVPYIGPIAAISLIALIALMQGSLLGMFVLIGALVFVNSVLFDQILTPRLLGRQVGLHPILSIIAFMAGNALAGIPGLLLAVPVAASLQIVVLHLVPRLRQQVPPRPPGPHPPREAEEGAGLSVDEPSPLEERYRLEPIAKKLE